MTANFYIRTVSMRSFFTVTALCVILFSCIVPTDTVEETFHFDRSASLDTIAPWGEVRIIFTDAPADSTPLRFTFDPPFYSFSIKSNVTRDTVRLLLSEPLQGNARYTIRTAEDMFSKTGALFEKATDSIVFYTAAAEQEPNNRSTIADTLEKECYGAIATVNDTDWYLIDEPTAKKVYLAASGSQTSFYLEDTSGTYTAKDSMDTIDTLPLPKDFSVPFYVVVHAYFQSVGGYYKVGYLTE